MQKNATAGTIGEPVKGRIGVLIEDHFDMTEFRKFNAALPARGYQVVYLSHLWGNEALTFGSNPDNGFVEEHVEVTTELERVRLDDFVGMVVIGGYASDRLRYQAAPRRGQPNAAPAVVFLREAVASERVKLGTICHSLWLYCADPALLRGRRVTCAHNIICDVENAGAEIVFDGDQTAEIVVDGNLISAKHPEATDRFIETFLAEIEARHPAVAAV